MTFFIIMGILCIFFPVVAIIFVLCLPPWQIDISKCSSCGFEKDLTKGKYTGSRKRLKTRGFDHYDDDNQYNSFSHGGSFSGGGGSDGGSCGGSGGS